MVCDVRKCQLRNLNLRLPLLKPIRLKLGRFIYLSYLGNYFIGDYSMVLVNSLIINP